jgi:hypothetical protein
MKHLLITLLAVSLMGCPGQTRKALEISEEKVTPTSTAPQEEMDISEMEKRNVLEIHVLTNGDIMVEGQPKKVGELTMLSKRFIKNPDQEPKLAASPKKAVIHLQSERGTNYERYLNVFNALKAAYSELWDEQAQALYGVAYSGDLSGAQRKLIRDEIPWSIAEGEPTEYKE